MEASLGRLRDANRAFARRYPGESARRQPVHTVYGGAQLFRSDSTAKIGGVARRAVQEYAPDADVFAEALGLADGALAEAIYTRVTEKLAREPVEDFRIDFEDGYGNRPDAEEDGHAAAVAREVARGMEAGTLPPFLGIRIKPLNEELRERSVRTLKLFLAALLERTGGTL
ncbi:MAG: phosphoenolpyruvate kinase, partial [Gemmatimonadota bacterium]|nr:phosphoenolpyruvate kinase [Gemmatimonadota bacterium]